MKCRGVNIEARTDLYLVDNPDDAHAGTMAHICIYDEETHPVDKEGRPLCKCKCGMKFIRGYK